MMTWPFRASMRTQPGSCVRGRYQAAGIAESGPGEPPRSKEMLIMPLHNRDTVRQQLDDCVFADRDLTRPVAKYRFPQQGTLPRDAFQLVADELMLDGNARQNLATFCQTWEEPEVLALMALSVNKNMIDRDEYPQSAEIERRCLHMMADLWNAPEAANTVGTSAIGSSEACMLAGMAAKWRWRAGRRAAGKPTDAPNFVCGPVQGSGASSPARRRRRQIARPAQHRQPPPEPGPLQAAGPSGHQTPQTAAVRR